MSSNGKTNTDGNDIDITRIPNEDHEQLARAIELFYKQDGTQKTRLAYNWERAARMMDGDQWLSWSGGAGGNYQWNSLQVSKANEYIPRPVTNYLFDAYQTLKSYITKTKPTTDVRPNTQKYADKAAAKVADLCIKANYERLKDQENFEYADSVCLMYGTAFKKDFWDTTAGGSIQIPQQMPDVDPMTGAPLDASQILNSGLPESNSLPLGDIATRVIEPYCIAIDPLATDLHTARWIMEYAIQPLDWIKDAYGKQEPGYTGLVDTVKEETQLSGSMRRFYQLKNSSGVKNASAIEGVGNSDTGTQQLTNCAIVKEYYERPSDLNPKGRMVVVANGVTLYAGESPCEGPEAGDWHPYSDYRWEIVPNRYWGKGAFDAACEIQKRINSIDATIMLARKTMAIPQKVNPIGNGVEPGQMTGRPGQVIFYRADVGPPANMPTEGVDAQVFQERAQCVDDIKTVTGAIDILKGGAPPQVGAASALSLLYEVGTGKLYPALDRRKRFIESSQKKQLKLTAKKYKEPRPEFVALLKKHNKDLSESDITSFLGSDLLDNCNVIVEAGSNVPKLEAMKQMRLQEAAQMGAIDMAVPENRAEYQRQMGIVGFDNDVGPDIKRAEWENDCLDNLLEYPDKKPVVLNCDDDAVHLAVLNRRMKEPSWMELDQQIQQAYMLHEQEHHDAQAMKLQQQAMQQMMTGQAPGPSQDGTTPTDTQSHGKGAPNSVREAAMSADVPPGEDV
jgi:hypothetical protein